MSSPQPELSDRMILAATRMRMQRDDAHAMSAEATPETVGDARLAEAVAGFFRQLAEGLDRGAASLERAAMQAGSAPADDGGAGA